MKIVRSALFVAWLYVLMAGMSIVLSPTLMVKGRRAARWSIDSYLALVFWGLRTICGITFEVRGRENLPTGGALIAMKHQSMFETMAAWTFLDDPAIILKRELADLPFFGWFARKMRNIIVDREGHATALRKMMREAQERVADGRQVVIFPEGTRGWPGEKIDYKPGAAALYRTMNTPCVPIALNSGLYWPPHGIMRNPGHIIVEVLEPIPPGLSRDAFMAELEKRIETASAALLPPDFAPKVPSNASESTAAAL